MTEPSYVSGTKIELGAASSDSRSYDVGSGADRTLIVNVGMYDASAEPTITALTYNGVSLTLRKRVSYNYAGTRYIVTEQWTLDNPASGSNTLSTTIDIEADVVDLHVYHFTGANNGVGTNTASTSGNVSDHEYDNDSDDSDGIHNQLVMSVSDRTVTEGSGTTVRLGDKTGGEINRGLAPKARAGVQTQSALL